MVCLPSSLKLMALIVSLAGGWVGYEVAKLGLGVTPKSLLNYPYTSFMGSM